MKLWSLQQGGNRLGEPHLLDKGSRKIFPWAQWALNLVPCEWKEPEGSTGSTALLWPRLQQLQTGLLVSSVIVVNMPQEGWVPVRGWQQGQGTLPLLIYAMEGRKEEGKVCCQSWWWLLKGHPWHQSSQSESVWRADVCSCHMWGLCKFTWSSKHWSGKLGLGTGMKVWLDPSKYFSWTILWICSLTHYLICRLDFTVLLQEFLWSTFLMKDLKSDSVLLVVLWVPKQGYEHVFHWNTLGGMAVHSEMIYQNLSPRWSEKSSLHPILLFFGLLGLQRKGSAAS